MAVTQLLEHLMDTLEGIRMPTRFIHLDRMPRDEEGVAELHQALQKCQDGPLADGWGEVSHWSAERMEAGDWTPALWRSPELAKEAWRYANHEDLNTIEGTYDPRFAMPTTTSTLRRL